MFGHDARTGLCYPQPKSRSRPRPLSQQLELKSKQVADKRTEPEPRRCNSFDSSLYHTHVFVESLTPPIPGKSRFREEFNSPERKTFAKDIESEDEKGNAKEDDKENVEPLMNGHKQEKGKTKQKHNRLQKRSRSSLKRTKSGTNFDWRREERLSAIVEVDSVVDSSPPKLSLNLDEAPSLDPFETRRSHFVAAEYGDLHTGSHDGSQIFETFSSMSTAGKSAASPTSGPPAARPIQPPPTDLAAIERIDASLVFEHFTTEDAWELGSALRNRLLPIPTPVVINISLANQNQVLFHTATRSGVMPDNETWVARKRRTVLRWGCSTWYMHCKFKGDEVAFREKYGLGIHATDYAIHGGGIPIRVTGVEGVVAVVVVSGLKQHEDHAVIVEVIRDMYY